MDLTTGELAYLLQYSRMRRENTGPSPFVEAEHSRLTKMLSVCCVNTRGTEEELKLFAATLSLEPDDYEEFIDIASMLDFLAEPAMYNGHSTAVPASECLYELVIEYEDVYLVPRDERVMGHGRKVGGPNSVAIYNEPHENFDEYFPVLEVERGDTKVTSDDDVQSRDRGLLEAVLSDVKAALSS